jgi:hypothetical protein
VLHIAAYVPMAGIARDSKQTSIAKQHRPGLCTDALTDANNAASTPTLSWQLASSLPSDRIKLYRCITCATCVLL